MSESKTYIMAHDIARRRAIDAVSKAPAGYVITVAEPRRNSAINAALHARLTEIAKTRQHFGRSWDVDVWKRLLTAAWCRATGQSVLMLPALDGAGVDIVFRRTSELTQAEARDLLAYIEAWDAETEEAA
jgi:hypothetical protein